MAALVNPIKPPVAIPKDPARSSFNVVTPEIWAHRDIPMDEDDGFVHVCFSLSFSLSLSLSLIRGEGRKCFGDSAHESNAIR